MTTETYNKNCPRCKTTTTHRAVFLSRKKGVKLMCLVCHYFTKRYYNLQKLNTDERGLKNE